MMKLTNKLGLPLPIVNAIANDPYTKGDADISVTALISPPRIVALKAKHDDEITEDASERIWSLVGQVIHGVLERAAHEGIAERRLYTEIDGVRVSGGMDLFLNDGTLQDYKFVTAYKFKDRQVPLEYEQQLNCYAEILRRNGEKVNKLQVVGILRDWSKMKARREADYPQTQVVVIDAPLWSSDKATDFIRERIALHKQAKNKLPECTSEERWAKPTVYAVMKEGRKTAVKLYQSKVNAEAHASQSTGLYVVRRQGESVRCEAYCAVSKFCEQYQSKMKKIKEK